MEPTLAFAVHEHDQPAIEVRVNFGVYAGRAATAAEIDRLALWLLDEVGEVSIISEERHEIDARSRPRCTRFASSSRVECPQFASTLERAATSGRRGLEKRILDRAVHWARQCVAERHVDVPGAPS